MSKPQRLVALFGLLLLLIFGGATAFILFTRQPTQVRAYRRYVSPPLLPDGTRYTLLYPNHLIARDGWFNPSQGTLHSVHMSASATKGEWLRLWSLRLRARFFPALLPPPGDLTVVVGRADKGTTQNKRNDTHWQDATVTDARSQLRLRIFQSNFSDAIGRSIADSLQFLPPGASVPPDHPGTIPVNPSQVNGRYGRHPGRTP